jgi:orotidine-5'-phosphate decarboxylase
VTILTSLNDQTIAEVGLIDGVHEAVHRLASLAYYCGLDGVVCSAQEVRSLKSGISSNLITVTPGIRLGNDHEDQERVMTPEAALREGADHLVIGRSITHAEDPVAVLRSIDLSV